MRTSVTPELAALQSVGDSVFVADRTTSSVDQPCSFLEVLQEVRVYKSACPFVQRTVDSDNIALMEDLVLTRDEN